MSRWVTARHYKPNLLCCIWRRTYTDGVTEERLVVSSEGPPEASQPKSAVKPPKKQTIIKPFTRYELSNLSFNEIKKDGQGSPNRLAHGLDRVLFNPGVHLLRDPRTNVFNFDPYLSKLTQPENFDFSRINSFVSAAADASLHDLARASQSRFVSSTSSITPFLSMMTHVMLENREPNLYFLSKDMKDEKSTYTNLCKGPYVALLRPHDDIFSLVVEEALDSTILLPLGNVIEKFLTLEPAQFEALKKGSSKTFEATPEVYHFLKANSFLLRSQLDCMDPRLPAPCFDLKSRATLPIRQDNLNYKNYRGYHLKHLHGQFESFEREQYDIVRSSLLKYYYQVCIGEMDGLFFAYHNTNEIFGFEYMSKEFIEKVLFRDSYFANSVFNFSLQSLDHVLNSLIESHQLTTTNKGKSLRLSMHINDGFTGLIVYSELLDALPEGPNPIDRFKASIEKPVQDLQKRTFRMASYINNKQERGTSIFTAKEADSWSLFLQEEVSPDPDARKYFQLRKKYLFGSSYSALTADALLQQLNRKEAFDQAFGAAASALVDGDVDNDEGVLAGEPSAEDEELPTVHSEPAAISNPLVRNIVKNYLAANAYSVPEAQKVLTGTWTGPMHSEESSTKDASNPMPIPTIKFNGRIPPPSSETSESQGRPNSESKSVKAAGTKMTKDGLVYLEQGSVKKAQTKLTKSNLKAAKIISKISSIRQPPSTRYPKPSLISEHKK